MLGHRHTPAGITPVATSASHASAPSARNCTASPTIGVPARPIRRQQHTHFAPPISVGSGLRVRYERRADIHEAFLQIAGCLICLKLLNAEASFC
jgi:hypothetical protein